MYCGRLLPFVFPHIKKKTSPTSMQSQKQNGRKKHLAIEEESRGCCEVFKTTSQKSMHYMEVGEIGICFWQDAGEQTGRCREADRGLKSREKLKSICKGASMLGLCAMLPELKFVLTSHVWGGLSWRWNNSMSWLKQCYFLRFLKV